MWTAGMQLLQDAGAIPSGRGEIWRGCGAMQGAGSHHGYIQRKNTKPGAVVARNRYQSGHIVAADYPVEMGRREGADYAC